MVVEGGVLGEQLVVAIGIGADRYDELFARLLSSEDLPVRVPESAVPSWMRDGRLPRLRPQSSLRHPHPVRRMLQPPRSH